MIYDSNEDKVQLQQELQYLEDYIDIQRLRMPDDIVVDYAVQGNPAGLKIEPMLLVPFVENAFKHGISYAEFTCVEIELRLVNQIWWARLSLRKCFGSLPTNCNITFLFSCCPFFFVWDLLQFELRTSLVIIIIILCVFF
jgi:hypothetical protein